MQKLSKILFFIVAVLCFMVTATASASSDCNHNWEKLSQKGADCETHYVTYRCTKCFDYKSENLAAIKAHNWQVAYKDEPSCVTQGGVNYVCLECGSVKSEYLSATGHDYTFTYNDDATCTKDGTKNGTCKKCGVIDMLPNEGSAKGHDFSGDWVLMMASTCIEKGVSKQTCKRCGEGRIRYEELAAHSDKNNDYKCDICRIDMSPQSDAKPSEDEVIKNCSCKCHKGGVSGFFWKIGNFFNRLFRIKSKQICTCGRYHF